MQDDDFDFLCSTKLCKIYVIPQKNIDDLGILKI